MSALKKYIEMWIAFHVYSSSHRNEYVDIGFFFNLQFLGPMCTIQDLPLEFLWMKTKSMTILDKVIAVSVSTGKIKTYP